MNVSNISVPASFFGMVLGLVGLGGCWRLAAKAWNSPPFIAEIIMVAGFVVWLLLSSLYLGKWIWARKEAVAELNHPIQNCFVGLSGIATMLAAVAIAPSVPTGLSLVLASVGGAMTLAYGVYFTARRWMGDHDLAAISPDLYLPTVGGYCISAFVAAYFGYESIGLLFLGAGMVSWIAVESLILARLNFAKLLLPSQRPSLGIMLTPPMVVCQAYLFVTGGLSGVKPDFFAQALLGYGLLQLVLLLGLLPWIMRQPFGASYWAFSFGLTALTSNAIIFMLRGQTGYIEGLSVALFILVNVTMVLLVIGTLWRLVQGKLLSPREEQP